jgi:flagellar assembly protein FliH
MISLSNLIKSTHYVSVDDKKMIEVLEQHYFEKNKNNDSKEESDSAARLQEEQTQTEDTETQALKEQILRDAEEHAQQLIEHAKQQAEEMKQAAKQEINAWWEERRQSDEEHIVASKASAAQEGLQAGYEEAEQQVLMQYQGQIQEAQQVLERASQEKINIIQEAEPFLIELSCGIAQKIVGKQLTLEPEWITQMVKKVLARKKEHGIITLCIAPAYFNYILDARDELILVMDSQAELQIIPDTSIQDQGCVVRSSFGSADAKIDTQLNEIKKALQHIAAAKDEEE